jgi:hypothetical protein
MAVLVGVVAGTRYGQPYAPHELSANAGQQEHRQKVAKAGREVIAFLESIYEQGYQAKGCDQGFTSEVGGH